MLNESKFEAPPYVNGKDSLPVLEPLRTQSPPWYARIFRIFKKRDFTMSDGTVVQGGTLLPKWSLPVFLVFGLGLGTAWFNEHSATVARDAARVEQDRALIEKLTALDKKMDLNARDLKLVDAGQIDISNQYSQIIGYLSAKTGKALKLQRIDPPKGRQSQEDQ